MCTYCGLTLLFFLEQDKNCVASWKATKLATFLSFVSRDILSSETLV